MAPRARSLLAEPTSRHAPVMCAEVIAALVPHADGLYVDGTFGAGGYTRAILEAADTQVIAFDRDPTAIAGGQSLTDQFIGRLQLIHARFGALTESLAGIGAGPVDGVVLDIGVSSMQLDEAVRGFSFLQDGPLDMRMSGTGESAADIVNGRDEEDIADILYHYGEERRSRAIARAIVKRRTDRPYTTTLELADTVASVLGRRQPDGRHPATRTFQALRIAVNDELGELARGLAAAEICLKPGGRLVVVTFHSLEDRIVKRFLVRRSGRESHGSRHLPAQSIKLFAPSFRIVNLKPLTPRKAELDANPRARSARLRAAERTEAAAVPFEPGEAGIPLRDD